MIQDVKIDKVVNQADEIQKQGDTAFRIKLVPQPDLTWTKAFEKAYNSTKTNMWRSAKIEGNMIHISCHHSQLVPDHMPALQKAVAAANDSSKKIEEAFEAQRAKNIAKEEEQKKLKEGILNNINSGIKGS